MHAKLSTRLGSDGAATHTLPPKHTQTHTHTSTPTARQTANEDAHSLNEATNMMPNKKKPNRK